MERALATCQAPEFIQTAIVGVTYGALTEAQNSSIPRILVLYGNSGIDKTRSLEEYISDNPTSTLIEVSPDFTFGSLLQEIAQEWRKYSKIP